MFAKMGALNLQKLVDDKILSLGRDENGKILPIDEVGFTDDRGNFYIG